MELNHVLILPRLRVQSANAVSGPLTWGFPSPTAFIGFAHAVERQLGSLLSEGFSGVGIICHHFEPQVYQPNGKRTHVFSLSRNPVDKDGASAALLEEGKAHFEVSLLIGVRDYLDEEDAEAFERQISDVVFAMRLAGGSILPASAGKHYQPRLMEWPEGEENQKTAFQKLRYQFLPGFALTLREDALQEALVNLRKKEPNATAIDALMDLSRLNYEPDALPDEDGKHEWHLRKHAGWLVPLAIGYAGISELYPAGAVQNSRDKVTPFRFVESLYSIGEWVSPHRIEKLEHLFWYPKAESEAGIYRCMNHYVDLSTVA